MNPTSDGTADIDRERRRALALLGLWGAAAILAPVLLKPLPALADEGGGGDGDGDNGHGDDDEGHSDEQEGQGGVRTGSSLPPEAP